MKRIFILIYCLLLSLPTWSQEEDWDTGWTREKEAFVVKQYHEFMDRFNFEQKTPIIKFFRKNYPGYPLTRADLIKSLFNIEDSTWDQTHQAQFIEAVTQEDNPQKIGIL